jgi:hypothetical protein
MMRGILVSLCLTAVLPSQAKAFNTAADTELLSYVAMPLAVSAVCDVPGVQTDRVGRLVSYMDQANVPPEDFIDAFRYVPVALELRTDGRPDFVEWVGGQVNQGIGGSQLVTVMERQLRTYDNYVPAVTVVSERAPRRRAPRNYYSYAYQDDYVPVVIRRHCERQRLDSLSLIDMPVAVARVCDLGNVPYERVSSLAIELNLGGVPAVQFVELMRYAPAGLAGGYGQPDFVQFVHGQRVAGISGYGLVRSADRQLRTYDITPQIDVVAPQYSSQNYYVAAPVQNYVAPVDTRFVPPVVQTRMARFAGSRIQNPGPVPAVAAAPQVERLFGAQGGAVVANPAQARRELAQGNRAGREAPIAAPAPVAAVAPGFGMGRSGGFRGPAPVAAAPVNVGPGAAGPRRGGEERGRRVEAPRAVAAPQPQVNRVVAAAPPGRGRERVAAPVTAPQPRPAVVAAPQGRGRERHIAAPTAAAPVAVARQNRGEGNGRERGPGGPPAIAPVQAQAPPPAQPAAAPGRGRGNGRGQRQAVAARGPAAPVAAPAAAPAAAAPPPVEQRGEHGRGGGGPAGRGPAPAAAAPAPAAAPPPAQTPPPNHGQEKKKEKGKDR